jgi:thiol-disulfide isomerase/thioredoxin
MVAWRLSVGALAVGFLLFWTDVVTAGGLPLIEFPVKPPAPELKLVQLNGEPFDIAAESGRIVIVNFWATWCAPCLKEMPAFEAAWKELQDEDILLVGVNLGDTPHQIGRFLKHRPVTFPILLDVESTTFDTWQIQRLPTTYIVGPDGMIHLGAIGDRDWASQDILDSIRRLK